MLALVAGAPAQDKPEKKRPQTPAKYDITKIGDRGIGGGLNLYSLKRERQMGEQLAAQVEAQVRLLRDPLIAEYVNRLTQAIVRNSDAKVPFTVKVIDNDEVNAFALPGGFLYVESGLVLAAENEAQIAGVIAHEVAHVAARHATKNSSRMEILNLASIPLIFVGGPAGYAVRQAMGLAVPISFLKFSRNAEREADLLGMEYMYTAGYDPTEMVQFFETLKYREEHKLSFIAKAFATHPMTKDRIKRAQKDIAKLLPERDEYVVTTSEFDAIKTRLAAIEQSHQINAAPSDRPVLRRRPPRDRDEKDDGDRPTLRRP
ncbi:MAG: M48 family metallopeptidase [Terriglobales bacterium]